LRRRPFVVISNLVDAKPRLFRSRQAWRDWLARNHDKTGEIWLAYYKKASGRISITYQEAVEEALCYGWIDSVIRRLDEERYAQKYTPRNAKSVWSAANKARVERLAARGLMAAPGLAKIEAAKRNGSWDRLNDVDKMGRGGDLPPDLVGALAREPQAQAAFDRRPPSEKKMWAYWVLSAKKPETRTRRVAETVKRVMAGRRPGM
jgi:uncharacterized protein YdeI (YjbR/CyaY-like superfamily)